MVVAGPLSLKMIVASLLLLKYSCRCRVVEANTYLSRCRLSRKPFYVVAKQKNCRVPSSGSLIFPDPELFVAYRELVKMKEQINLIFFLILGL